MLALHAQGGCEAQGKRAFFGIAQHHRFLGRGPGAGHVNPTVPGMSTKGQDAFFVQNHRAIRGDPIQG